MKETEIKTLLQLKNHLLSQINKKEKIIKEFQEEIELIQKQIENISNIISNASFISAENLIDAETAAKGEISGGRFQLKKKIFSPDTNELLADITFSKNQIDIRFTDPQKVNLTQEKFITDIVKPILLPLKNIEKNLQSNVTKIESGIDIIISSIVLDNVQNYESFSNFFDEFRDYLLKNYENLKNTSI